MLSYKKYEFPDRKFPVGIVFMYPQGPTSLHSHDFEELAIVTAGSGKHLYEGRLYDISAGDVYTIKPGMKHGYPETDELRLINILSISSELGIASDDLDEISGYHVLFDLEPKYRTRTGFKSRLKLNPAQLNCLVDMVEELNAELSSARPGYRFMAIADLRRVIGFISRAYSGASGRNVRAMLIISRAIRHIEKNMAIDLDVPSLAAASYVSESTLLRAFKDSTGMTPVRYIAEYRIRKACELLRGSSDDISMIAMRTGYSDSNYFSRQFRQITGITPGEYRGKHGA